MAQVQRVRSLAVRDHALRDRTHRGFPDGVPRCAPRNRAAGRAYGVVSSGAAQPYARPCARLPRTHSAPPHARPEAFDRE